MSLSHDETERYARHLILPEVGVAGQLRLRRARVLCVGAGGLGSPAAYYLAAAGVGILGIVDSDRVELSNLQRQILHGTPDMGRPKTDSAGDALRRLNPGIELRLFPVRLSATNILGYLSDFDIIVDGSDNFPTRYLVNDACVMARKPCVSGAVFRFEGQATVFAPHLGGPCYRCLFPEPPPPGAAPGCLEAGVMGAMPGIVGCIQAAEAIKLILGQGTSLIGRLLVMDALAMKFRDLKIRPDPQCALCGRQPSIHQLADIDPVCTAAFSTSNSAGDDEVAVDAMQDALDHPELNVRVIDVREVSELQGASISGTCHLSMSTIQLWSHELSSKDAYLLVCHSGVRSMRAAQWLKSIGFSNVKSVRGGFKAWKAWRQAS